MLNKTRYELQYINIDDCGLCTQFQRMLGNEYVGYSQVQNIFTVIV